MSAASRHHRVRIDHHDGLVRRARELPQLPRAEANRVLSAIKAQGGTSDLFLVGRELARDLLTRVMAAVTDALAAVGDGAALLFLRMVAAEEHGEAFLGHPSQYFHATAEARHDGGVSLVRALVAATAAVPASLA